MVAAVDDLRVEGFDLFLQFLLLLSFLEELFGALLKGFHYIDFILLDFLLLFLQLLKLH